MQDFGETLQKTAKHDAHKTNKWEIHSERRAKSARAGKIHASNNIACQRYKYQYCVQLTNLCIQKYYGRALSFCQFTDGKLYNIIVYSIS